MKGKSLRPKIASFLTTALISGLLVSIPVPAVAAACVPDSTTAGGDRVLTFSTVGNCDWDVPAGVTAVRVLVVGGGSSGGAGQAAVWWPQGGGGGAVVENTNFSITSSTIAVSVGVGGAAINMQGAASTSVNNGGQSRFGTITANGGTAPTNTLAPGGTSGNGNLGGNSTGQYVSGGGGGAGGAGNGTTGGVGINSNISGATVMYGSGGAGSSTNTGSASSGGGSNDNPPSANRGGGGSQPTGSSGLASAGAAGVVIIRYATTILCSPNTTSAGTDTVLTFTATGTCTWTPPANVSTFQLLVVGAGGGAGSSLGGGGGGGRVISESGVTISEPATITVGVGGAGGNGSFSANTNHGKTGGRSSVVSGSVNIVSLGGSGGNGRVSATNLNSDGTAISTGYTGGGGAYENSPAHVAIAGTGGAGFIGGNGSYNGGGGGGGAGGPGVARGNGSTPASAASSGGIGVSNSITGTATYYGGGGGASWYGGPGGWTGAGGLGGGGQGANGNSGSAAGANGTANTGGGGGGGYDGLTGGNGGSGVVIIRYGIPNGFSAILFNANNGTGSDPTSVISTTNGGTLPSRTSITRTGFEFLGWNTSANGSGTPYALGAAITVSADTTLYAQWSRITNPSCAANVGKGGIQSTTLASTKAGNGCVAISFAASGVNSTVTFNYTGANQSWTVPTGVTSATFYLFGAGGGGNTRTSGGGGGYATGAYSVTAGQIYTIIVGEGGGGDVAVTVTGLTGKYTKITYGGGGRGGSTDF
ncbi:MAG: InlB B-repeat-containing protein, partial [Candidatus Planktophila sp.]|nr:InlB B-repeat-containing protein [Candidatus Planktophila sp.]